MTPLQLYHGEHNSAKEFLGQPWSFHVCALPGYSLLQKYILVYKGTAGDLAAISRVDKCVVRSRRATERITIEFYSTRITVVKVTVGSTA